MDYKANIQKELDKKWEYLRTFGTHDDDDEDDDDEDDDEEQRLILLCSEILHYASEVGDIDKINILFNDTLTELNIEIDVDETVDNSGQTPLLLASDNGYPDIVEILIANGANVNLASISGTTPLIAVSQDSVMDKDIQLNIVTQLIEAKADVNHTEQYGKTPLILATESNSPKIVSKLLQSGADISIIDKQGKTALEIAVDWEMNDIVKIIEDYMGNQNELKTNTKRRGGTKKKRNKNDKKNKNDKRNKKTKINKSKRHKTL